MPKREAEAAYLSVAELAETLGLRGGGHGYGDARAATGAVEIAAS
jgi:hypothetical protein